MPKWLIFDAFTLLIREKNVANYALLRCKTFSPKIWLCKIFDKFHVWRFRYKCDYVIIVKRCKHILFVPPTVIETEVRSPSTTNSLNFFYLFWYSIFIFYFYTLFLYLTFVHPSAKCHRKWSLLTVNDQLIEILETKLFLNNVPRYCRWGWKVHHALVLSTSHSQNEMQLLVGYWLRASCEIHLTCESARQRYPKWGILKVHNAQNAMKSSITANSI